MIARHEAPTSRQPDRGSAHRPTSSRASVLVAVRDAREEVVAGWGAALLAVRTLDGCSCDLHEGELLLLTGGVASGARALLRAFHGHAPRLQVRRRVAEGVQIRRGVIDGAAVEAILCGWRDAETPCLADDDAPASTRRVVYLLRVRSAGRGRSPERHAGDGATVARRAAGMDASWRPWAAALRRGGGAIALACDSIAATEQKRRATPKGDTPLELIRESAIDGQRYESPADTPVRLNSRPGVRVLALSAGRIVSESADSRG